MNFLMMDRLQYYGYSYYNRSFLSFLIIPFLIILPMGIEMQWFKMSKKNAMEDFKTLFIDLFYYVKRCCYFYSVYLEIVTLKKFSSKLINSNYVD